MKIKPEWLKDVRDIVHNDNKPRSLKALVRCDWCGEVYRRWFMQRVCTNCVVAPRGAYSRRVYELVMWGLACGSCGMIGSLATWLVMK